MNNVKQFNKFLNEEFVKNDGIIDLIQSITSNKIKVNKYEFKNEINFEFIVNNLEYTLSIDSDDNTKVLFIDGVETNQNDKEIDVLYDFLLHYSFVKESNCSIFSNELNEGFFNNSEIDKIKNYLIKNKDTRIHAGYLISKKEYFYLSFIINDIIYRIDINNDNYSLFKDNLNLNLNSSDVEKLKIFLIDNCYNIIKTNLKSSMKKESNNKTNEGFLNKKNYIEIIKNYILENPNTYVYKYENKIIEVDVDDKKYVIDLLTDQIIIDNINNQYNEEEIDELVEFILINCKDIDYSEDILDDDDEEIDDEEIFIDDDLYNGIKRGETKNYSKSLKTSRNVSYNKRDDDVDFLMRSHREDDDNDRYNDNSSSSSYNEKNNNMIAKKESSQNGLNEGFINSDNDSDELEFIKKLISKHPNMLIKLLPLKMYLFMENITYCLNFYKDEYYTLYKNDKKLKISVKKVKELKDFILSTSTNIDDYKSYKKSLHYDPDWKDYQDSIEDDKKRKEKKLTKKVNKYSDEADDEARQYYEKNNNINMKKESNVVSFNSFINEEARISKENKIIKDILDDLENIKELKVKYTEHKTPKLLVDVEFKFKLNDDSYVFIKQKSNSNRTIIIVNKNGEKILSETVDSKSLLSLVNKLDSKLISFVKNTESIKEELNIDDKEFSEDEKIFDEDDELEDNSDEYNSDDIKEVDSLIYMIRSAGTDNIEIENDIYEDDLESANYFEFTIDDESYIFEFSDSYFYAEKDGVEVLTINDIEDIDLVNKLETLKEEIIDVYNTKLKDITKNIESSEEAFESKRLKSYKGFQYIEEDEDDIDYEYKITCED